MAARRTKNHTFQALFSSRLEYLFYTAGAYWWIIVIPVEPDRPQLYLVEVLKKLQQMAFQF